MTTITESIVEEAALEWLSGLGWQTAHGPHISPDTPGAERNSYDEVRQSAMLSTASRTSCGSRRSRS